MKRNLPDRDSVRIKLAEKLEAKNNLLHHIYEISSLLTRSPNLDEVLNEIADRAMHGLHFDRAIVMLLNEDGTKLECKCVKGFTLQGEKRAWDKPLIMGRHKSFETRVVFQGMPLFVPDTENAKDMSWIDVVINRYQERKSVLYVPLKIKDKILGFLGVDRFRTRMKITQDDIESLVYFANQVSIIIENTRLYKAISDEKILSESIINCSVNGIIISDLTGNILNVNPRAEEILGISRNEMLRMRIQDIFKFDQAERRKIYRALTHNENIYYFDFNYSRPEGKRLILNLGGFAVIDENRNSLGAVTAITDMTEKKKMDDYLMRVERLAALGRIAAGIAHEIRNPLAGIYTTAQNLEREIGEHSAAGSDLQNIMQEIDRIEKLIRDVLNLIRPMPLQIEEIDIHQLLLTTMALLKKEMSQKNISLKTELNAGRGYLKADSNRLRQVFLNLTLNAIEAISDHDGLIEVKTDATRGNDGAANWMVIHFKDNG
ncbi:MAG: PAS domain S-box protein, partial [Deltaproteobacteria bacterium]|nr:PAS domain S-box protein [Deltaproteobacteria bacterium]